VGESAFRGASEPSHEQGGPGVVAPVYGAREKGENLGPTLRKNEKTS